MNTQMCRALKRHSLLKWLAEKTNVDFTANMDIDFIEEDEQFYEWYYADNNDIDIVARNSKNDVETKHYILNQLFIKMVDYCANNQLYLDKKYLVDLSIKEELYHFFLRNSQNKN